MEFHHITVLREASVDALHVRAGGMYADLTLGGGGHTSLILERGGSVLGVDRDSAAIETCKARFASLGAQFSAAHDNFSNIKAICAARNIGALDGIVMDLGVSSHQLDEGERGFSYMQSAPLDMRMDKRQALSAYHVVNEYDEDALYRVICDYGEERWARRIAKFIVEARETAPIQTTGELVDLIKAAVPLGARRDGPHPAKRTFQAIRIEVNGELAILEKTLEDAISILKKDGRIAVITFHSLEDRIVKTVFARLAKGCTCPKSLPICVCGNVPTVRVITRKPILPDESELEQNPRARSSKLRVAQKIV